MKLKKLCLSLTLIFLFCTSLTPIHAASSSLDKITMNIFINSDGSAVIEESWSGTFVVGTENYKSWNNMNDASIHSFSVRDENQTYTTIDDWDIDATFSEKAYQCGIIEDGDDYELCYGISQYGQHTYTMSYTIDHFVSQYQEAQGFNFQLVSSDMNPAPHEFEIFIKSDHPFYDESCDIYGFGYNGQVIFDDQGGIYMANYDINDHTVGYINYANIVCKIDGTPYLHPQISTESIDDVIEDAKDGSSYQDDDTLSLRFLFITIILVIVCGSLLSYIIWKLSKRYAGRSMKYSDGQNKPLLKSDIDMFRDIPCQKDIYYFYYLALKAGLIQNNDRGGLVSALLLKWIRDGIVQFEKIEGTGLFKKDSFEIDFRRVEPFDNPIENKLLTFFKQASGTNKILERKEFEKWCKHHYDDVESWFESMTIHVEKQMRQNHLLEKKFDDISILGIRIPHDQIIYHPQVREDMKHVIGFEKFLKDMSLIDEKEVIEVKLWEEYLIFASILSLADEVEKQLGKLCPEFNEQSHIDYMYTSMATRHFVYAGIRSASNAYATAHSASSLGGGGSSSFGGGGGGFSGGGGGGSR